MERQKWVPNIECFCNQVGYELVKELVFYINILIESCLESCRKSGDFYLLRGYPYPPTPDTLLANQIAQKINILINKKL